MLKRTPPSDDRAKSQRARARLARSRRKRGEIVVSIVIEENPVVEALLESERLSEEQALRRPQVEAALGKLIAEWVCRWQRHA
jgi:hypothetical protein